MAEKPLSPATLAEGALRALEQAFRLADDAYLLFVKNRWPTAVVLALFAREELGRYAILAEATKGSKAGKSITPKAIEKLCEDHLEKLKRGFVSTSVVLSVEDSALMEEFFKNPDTAESKQFRERLDRMHAAKVKRQHDDAHKLRLRALYVELSPAGRWILPADVSRDEAELETRTAAADCANTVARFWGETEVLALLKSVGLTPSFKMPLAIAPGDPSVSRGA